MNGSPIVKNSQRSSILFFISFNNSNNKNKDYPLHRQKRNKEALHLSQCAKLQKKMKIKKFESFLESKKITQFESLV